MTPPLLPLEEHFFSTPLPPPLLALYKQQLAHIPGLLPKLTDLSTLRRRNMAAGGVALQVISHGPGLGEYGAAVCRAANDQLAEAIRRDAEDGSGRGCFAGFAALPMGEPDAAGAEVGRAVRELGFVGVMVDNHCRGRFYEGAGYEGWWEAVEALGVPVYLHPTWAGGEMMERYRGEEIGEAAAGSMASSGMGWHSETALHVLRLFASGLFDRRPRLKIVVGHMGEMIPFMLQRIQKLSRRWGAFERDFGAVYNENIWITTSGVWSLDPMRCILANTRLDHILYSVDYPFVPNEAGLEWMRELEQSGLVDEEQLRAIAYGNAEKLLGIKVPSGDGTCVN